MLLSAYCLTRCCTFVPYPCHMRTQSSITVSYPLLVTPLHLPLATHRHAAVVAEATAVTSCAVLANPLAILKVPCGALRHCVSGATRALDHILQGVIPTKVRRPTATTGAM